MRLNYLNAFTRRGQKLPHSKMARMCRKRVCFSERRRRRRYVWPILAKKKIVSKCELQGVLARKAGDFKKIGKRPQN